MDKNDKKTMYIIIFVGSLLGTVAVLGILLLFTLKHVIIDQKSINLLDMYIKASFSFFGSIFSIGTSLLIFHLQNSRKAKDEKNKKVQLIEFLQKKNKENLIEIDKIYKIISKKGIEVFLAEFKNEEKELKEIFLIIYTAINVKSMDSTLMKLDPSDGQEATILEEFNLINEIDKLLALLLEKTETEQGKEQLIRKIFLLTEKAKYYLSFYY
ncbi:hypothetical protein ABE869_10160 [Enterococcus gilvus]|uniref:hypothetical protein n=1 Tax=Enterococcus gilvus TaxID=160453 RepID=UPI003D6A8575